MSNARLIRLIHDAIQKLELDLNGLVVFTEMGTGYYATTPVIAVMAGASDVIAVTRDSQYGSAHEAMLQTFDLSRDAGVSSRILMLTEEYANMIEMADVVTNLGFVRPIDKDLLSHMKPTAAVPLMYEAWELRNSDLDLEECNRRGICVLATNEGDDRLRTLDYLGHLCAKLLYENGIEVFKSRILVTGNGKFGKHISRMLGAMGVCVTSELDGLDAVITTDHMDDRVIIGAGGYIEVGELKKRSPDVLVLNLAGNIDREALDSAGIRYLPQEKEAYHMGWTLAELGARPVIDLHTAGLKVGEIMVRLRLRGLTPDETLREAVKNPLCQSL